jgi:hypothetical protein
VGLFSRVAINIKTTSEESLIIPPKQIYLTHHKYFCMAAPSIVEEILKHQHAEKIIEELLDIALTTLNAVNIDPRDGEQLADYFINKSLYNHEAVSLLLKIDLAAEPDKTRKTLKNYGITREA